MSVLHAIIPINNKKGTSMNKSLISEVEEIVSIKSPNFKFAVLWGMASVLLSEKDLLLMKSMMEGKING